jgi:hypothetical protein
MAILLATRFVPARDGTMAAAAGTGKFLEQSDDQPP